MSGESSAHTGDEPGGPSYVAGPQMRSGDYINVQVSQLPALTTSLSEILDLQPGSVATHELRSLRVLRGNQWVQAVVASSGEWVPYTVQGGELVNEEVDPLGVEWRPPTEEWVPVDPIQATLWTITSLIPTEGEVERFREEIRRRQTAMGHVEAGRMDPAFAPSGGQGPGGSTSTPRHHFTPVPTPQLLPPAGQRGRLTPIQPANPWGFSGDTDDEAQDELNGTNQPFPPPPPPMAPGEGEGPRKAPVRGAQTEGPAQQGLMTPLKPVVGPPTLPKPAKSPAKEGRQSAPPSVWEQGPGQPTEPTRPSETNRPPPGPQEAMGEVRGQGSAHQEATVTRTEEVSSVTQVQDQASGEGRTGIKRELGFAQKAKMIEYLRKCMPTRWNPDGNVSFQNHVSDFEQFSSESSIAPEETFKATLGRKAREIYDALPEEVRNSYEATKAAMLAIVEGEDRLEEWEERFLARKQMRDEKVLLYRVALASLAKSAYPNMSASQIDAAVFKRMKNGLRKEIRDALVITNPKSMGELERLAQRVERNNDKDDHTVDHSAPLRQMEALTVEDHNQGIWVMGKADGLPNQPAQTGQFVQRAQPLGGPKKGGGRAGGLSGASGPAGQGGGAGGNGSQSGWWTGPFPGRISQTSSDPVVCRACGEKNHWAQDCKARPPKKAQQAQGGNWQSRASSQGRPANWQGRGGNQAVQRPNMGANNFGGQHNSRNGQWVSGGGQRGRGGSSGRGGSQNGQNSFYFRGRSQSRFQSQDPRLNGRNQIMVIREPDEVQGGFVFNAEDQEEEPVVIGHVHTIEALPQRDNGEGQRPMGQEIRTPRAITGRGNQPGFGCQLGRRGHYQPRAGPGWHQEPHSEHCKKRTESLRLGFVESVVEEVETTQKGLPQRSVAVIPNCTGNPWNRRDKGSKTIKLILLTLSMTLGYVLERAGLEEVAAFGVKAAGVAAAGAVLTVLGALTCLAVKGMMGWMERRKMGSLTFMVVLMMAMAGGAEAQDTSGYDKINQGLRLNLTTGGPMFCQADGLINPTYWQIPLPAKCPIMTPRPTKQSWQVKALMFKQNIIRHTSIAKRCVVRKEYFKSLTWFFGDNTREERWTETLRVTEAQCRWMIKNKVCEATGEELKEHKGHWQTTSVLNTSPWPGGATCCSWGIRTNTLCLILEGGAFQRWGSDTAETNLGDVSDCHAKDLACTLDDGSQVIWEPNVRTECSHELAITKEGELWDEQFLSKDRTWSLTFSERKELNVCGQATQVSDQEIPVIFVNMTTQPYPAQLDSMWRNVVTNAEEVKESRGRRRREARRLSGVITSDVLASKLQALHYVTEESRRVAFGQIAYTVCRSMQEMQALQRTLIQTSPLLAVRLALGRNDIFVKPAADGLLRVFPCKEIPRDQFQILPQKEPNCTEEIPIRWQLDQNSMEGFLNPIDNTIHLSSTPAPCPMAQDTVISLFGRRKRYLRSEGILKDISDQVFKDLGIYNHTASMFTAPPLIFRASSFHSLADTRDHVSLNHMMRAVTSHQRVLENLGKDHALKEDGETASHYAQSLYRRGMIGLLFGDFDIFAFWQMLCNVCVTTVVLWKLFAPRCLKNLVNRLSLPDMMTNQFNHWVSWQAHNNTRRQTAVLEAAPLEIEHGRDESRAVYASVRHNRVDAAKLLGGAEERGSTAVRKGEAVSHKGPLTPVEKVTSESQKRLLAAAGQRQAPAPPVAERPKALKVPPPPAPPLPPPVPTKTRPYVPPTQIVCHAQVERVGGNLETYRLREPDIVPMPWKPLAKLAAAKAKGPQSTKNMIAWVPLKDGGRDMRLVVKVNGSEQKISCDSGASFSVAPASWAEKLGGEVRELEAVVTAETPGGGRIDFTHAVDAELQWNGATTKATFHISAQNTCPKPLLGLPELKALGAALDFRQVAGVGQEEAC